MKNTALPQHIAIVMDGNGRWAKKRFLPRVAGHKAGVEAVKVIVKACAKKQIKVLSLFAFSNENWRRPAQEVNHLMDLFMMGLEREVPMLHDNQIQLRFIGDSAKFNEKLRNKIQEVQALTCNNTGTVLQIAADYGGQWDITTAARKLAHAVKRGEIEPDDITVDSFSRALSFADLPNPDLFIRTSGEIRISNFMLWQLAYAELYFTEVLWPDFDEAELDKALQHFAGRERRFGLISVRPEEHVARLEG